MLKFTIRRVAWTIPVILLVILMTFLLMRLIKGNPFQVTERAVPPSIQRNLERKYNLDKPLYYQYLAYLGNAVRGDFGPSYAQRNRTVADIIKEFFPNSAKLGLVAIAVSVVLGVGLGVVAAVKQNTVTDYLAMFLAVVGISTPAYVTASVLIWVLSLKLNLVPTNGWGGVFDRRIIIPVIALSFQPIAVFARYTRASVLGVLRQDYVRTARAKGVHERMVLWRHVLRNALIPVATVGGVLFVFIITGSFVVETIYNIPGIGNYFVRSATGRDYPMLMGLTLLFAFLIVVANLLVDLVYAWLDPRISYK